MKEHFDFASDTVSGVCAEVMEVLLAINKEPYARSYGEDATSSKAAARIAEIFGRECAVYFVASGTAANAFALSLLVDSSQAIICHPHAHIAVDEANAPEFFTAGAKLLFANGRSQEGFYGKMDPKEIEAAFSLCRGYHSAEPKAISISESTEVGTVYTAKEIRDLVELARNASLRVHIDGARLANAVVAEGCQPAELIDGVDILSFGGSKNGGLPCEAIVCFADDLMGNQPTAERIKRKLKRSGQLVAKGRFLSASWLGLLTDGVWLKNAQTANSRAAELADGFSERGISLAVPIQTNQVFVNLPPDTAERLKEQGWQFYYFSSVEAYRFVCSWNTSREAILELLRAVDGP